MGGEQDRVLLDAISLRPGSAFKPARTRSVMRKSAPTVAEAHAEAARQRGDEHLRRAEQAEARLDQMLANQTAMALTMKEQQYLVGYATSRRLEPQPEQQQPARLKTIPNRSRHPSPSPLRKISKLRVGKAALVPRLS